jgi:hypothetical protein
VIGVIFFPLYNILHDVADIVVDRSYEPRVEKVIVPPKPKDVKREAFLETCPKYGFSRAKCEYIWTHEDDQTALTPKAKDVKIEITETPLIEDKE